jgi:hypothetical protein
MDATWQVICSQTQTDANRVSAQGDTVINISN